MKCKKRMCTKIHRQYRSSAFPCIREPTDCAQHASLRPALNNRWLCVAYTYHPLLFHPTLVSHRLIQFLKCFFFTCRQLFTFLPLYSGFNFFFSTPIPIQTRLFWFSSSGYIIQRIGNLPRLF